MAAGTLDTDAVNVAQLKALNDKVTDGTLSSGKNITIHTTTDANGVKKNTIDLNDNITFGSDTDVANEVKVDGTKGQVVIGDAKNGGIVIGNQDNGKVQPATMSQDSIILNGIRTISSKTRSY